MADRLTQLQDCLDQLSTQFYASLKYITTHHPPGQIPNQPAHDLSPPSPTTQNNSANPPSPSQEKPPSQQQQQQNLNTDPDYRPASPNTFAAATRELARDLVIKEQQIELLIRSLPTVETTRLEQEEKIKRLDGELRDVEKERVEVKGVKDGLLERVEAVICGVKRV
ncbi:RNA polymerase II mediator complex subunit [Bachmanniomyces sp. S44760]|nr:RNA polymerase II mediator complex subunit [Bachmanniomyces sp. S44760]